MFPFPLTRLTLIYLFACLLIWIERFVSACFLSPKRSCPKQLFAKLWTPTQPHAPISSSAIQLSWMGQTGYWSVKCLKGSMLGPIEQTPQSADSITSRKSKLNPSNAFVEMALCSVTTRCLLWFKGKVTPDQ